MWIRAAGDIVLFSCESASLFRFGAAAKQTTLIEIVDDVTGAVRRLYKEKSSEKEP